MIGRAYDYRIDVAIVEQPAIVAVLRARASAPGSVHAPLCLGQMVAIDVAHGHRVLKVAAQVKIAL